MYAWITTRSGSSSRRRGSTCSSTMDTSSSGSRYPASVASPSGGNSAYLTGRSAVPVASTSAGRIIFTRMRPGYGVVGAGPAFFAEPPQHPPGGCAKPRGGSVLGGPARTRVVLEQQPAGRQQHRGHADREEPRHPERRADPRHGRRQRQPERPVAARAEEPDLARTIDDLGVGQVLRAWVDAARDEPEVQRAHGAQQAAQDQRDRADPLHPPGTVLVAVVPGPPAVHGRS